MTKYDIRPDDLIDNPTPRLPIAFCLDGSGSMDGEPIEELNRGLELFYEAVKADPTAKHSAETAIVLFAEHASVEQDFGPILNAPAPFVKIPHDCGGTMLGEGTNLALDLLDQRKEDYRSKGIEYYQPWLVIITDGYPHDSPYPDLVARIAGLTSKRKLSVFVIGVGTDADLDALVELSPKRPPIRLKGLNFEGVFEFLSQRVSRVSGSQPGEEVELDTSGIAKWAVA